eukprot:1498878-Amphidinium_carterae.1
MQGMQPASQDAEVVPERNDLAHACATLLSCADSVKAATGQEIPQQPMPLTSNAPIRTSHSTSR